MPVTERRLFSVNQPSFRSISRFLMLLVLTASGTILCAQTVTIKLVDGRTGHPMLNSYVNVWVGPNPQKETMMMIPTDKDGIARLRLTDNDNEVYIHRRNKFPGDSVVNDPIVNWTVPSSLLESGVFVGHAEVG